MVFRFMILICKVGNLGQSSTENGNGELLSLPCELWVVERG